VFARVAAPGGASEQISTLTNVDAYWIAGSRSSKQKPKVVEMNSPKITLNWFDSSKFIYACHFTIEEEER
jgi:hypothetical protein